MLVIIETEISVCSVVDVTVLVEVEIDVAVAVEVEIEVETKTLVQGAVDTVVLVKVHIEE